RLPPAAAIPEWAYLGEFFSITKTAEELSIVCLSRVVPESVEKDSGWKVLKIEGLLNFNLVGILAQVSAVLAESEVSIFAISTYNTDYILVKNRDFDVAVVVLRKDGHEVVQEYSRCVEDEPKKIRCKTN
ncbi:MAG: hypothetical protein H6Q76_639, partial [Firmicutes bacterium]|nr:hypothetical protein [Bacillota bacterium]